MNRRDLLKAVAAAGLIAANIKRTPIVQAQAALPLDFGIEFVDEKTLNLIAHDPVPLIKLYRRVNNIWDLPEMMIHPMPMTRFTDHLFRMENGYEFTERSSHLLSHGTLQTTVRGKKEFWMSNIDLVPPWTVNGKTAEVLVRGDIKGPVPWKPL